MKRILVFSDTHGDINTCIDVINNIPSDMIIHAGDISRDVVSLRKKFPNKKIIAVCGNNDFVCPDPYDTVAELDGVRIFVTHGHRYRVKYEFNYNTLAEAAIRNNCTVAVFGHTHCTYEGETLGVKLLNPGSTKYNKNYGIIEIENEEIKTCII